LAFTFFAAEAIIRRVKSLQGGADMKIRFPTRVKFTREIAVGLAVLLVLTVTLSVVAARRFVRRDAAIAAEDERFPERQDEIRIKDSEARHEAFRPTLPVSASEPALDREKDQLRQDKLRDEKREAKFEQPVQLGFATTDVSKPATVAKLERHEETKLVRKAEELPAPPLLDADDRYGAATAAPVAIGLRDRAEAGGAKPQVIPVSGDSPDGFSRRIDGQMPERRPDARHPELTSGGNAFAGDAPTPIANVDREQRGMRPIESRNEMPPATPAYPARDPRFGNNAASAVPIENGRPGYPGPAGYVPEGAMRPDQLPRRDDIAPRNEIPRHDDFQRPVGENPLRSDGLYEVQPNDSYWTISQRVYGSGAYFRALAEVNRGKAARPDRLQPGLLISTPPVAQLEKDYPDFCPRPSRRDAVRNRAAAGASLASYSGERIYVVREGDTLSSIARNELGKVSRWAEIYQLNREALGKDYDYLTPGMKLAMPPREGQPTERMTRRNDDLPTGARY
jgi:nucleoid-associated protein YgaU